jgi:2-polyprenyl-3-methyl-5-hydroxy-6-metoxy-1,4-benzoquinol methylase
MSKDSIEKKLPDFITSEYPLIKSAYEKLNSKTPYLSSVFIKQYNKFGNNWRTLFEKELNILYGNNSQALDLAIDGYIKFCLEGMILQKKFNKTRCYENKTYEEAASEVYQNKDYMFDLYLPGILLSHYLWSHHFAQLVYFYDEFLPLVKEQGGTEFLDVGIGSGFYSKEVLLNVKNSQGNGVDMSPFSIEYTHNTLTSWKLNDRYTSYKRNIITQPLDKKFPLLINIEVLEHLEDPLSFLKSLFNQLEVGGLGFISAAINAPNADHIYLYNNIHEVIEQVKEAGFSIISYQEDMAYEPKSKDELVPINGVLIVTKKK